MTATLTGVRYTPSIDAIVALDTSLTADLPGDIPVVSLRHVLTEPLVRTELVQIHVPPYRPASTVALLAFVASRLGQPGAQVVWIAPKRELRRLRHTLARLGWTVDAVRIDGIRALAGTLPAVVAPPHPNQIEVTLGTITTWLSADYGVFASERLDDGTAHLLATALTRPPVPVVADIGTGYGPLALGMLLNGNAGAAVASDVDAFALLLASLNASHHHAPLTCGTHRTRPSSRRRR